MKMKRLVMEKNHGKLALASFGAATAALYMTPSAESGVINITPTTLPFLGN
jgi:hypothetical protein